MNPKLVSGGPRCTSAVKVSRLNESICSMHRINSRRDNNMNTGLDNILCVDGGDDGGGE